MKPLTWGAGHLRLNIPYITSNQFVFEGRGKNGRIQRETFGRIVEKQQTPQKCLNQDVTNRSGFRPPFTQL